MRPLRCARFRYATTCLHDLGLCPRLAPIRRRWHAQRELFLAQSIPAAGLRRRRLFPCADVHLAKGLWWPSWYSLIEPPQLMDLHRRCRVFLHLPVRRRRGVALSIWMRGRDAGNTSHFHLTKSGEYITQLTMIGPLAVEYLGPAYDPPLERHPSSDGGGNAGFRCCKDPSLN